MKIISSSRFFCKKNKNSHFFRKKGEEKDLIFYPKCAKIRSKQKFTQIKKGGEFLEKADNFESMDYDIRFKYHEQTFFDAKSKRNE